MKMIRAVVRREKENDIALALERSGFPALTKMDVLGRGRQRGIKIGSAKYEEVSKLMLMLVVEDRDVERAIDIIKVSARTGNFGDGKIFVTPVEGVLTIRTGEAVL
ncbi:MAG: nitrogen fixation protein NifD [Omnitrophica bacterium RIFCSPLOWO2_12_FULL_50_11]|nr:MAG: nitrogen fixation protein NifD [Omnitrophica bacterium RIFCSPLOWO2_12_FULL_50_11]